MTFLKQEEKFFCVFKTEQNYPPLQEVLENNPANWHRKSVN